MLSRLVALAAALESRSEHPLANAIPAAASVSFAMGAAGTDAALETAEVALMRDDLSKLAEAVGLSREAGRVI